MIHLHKLNGQEFVVNAEMIESVEAHGAETVIHLATGNRMVVAEKVSEVVRRTVDYRRSVFVGAMYVPEFLKSDKGTSGACVDAPRVPSTRNKTNGRAEPCL